MAETTSENSSSSSVSQYLTEVRGEIRKVTWATRSDATRLTGIVIAATAAMSFLLYAFDWVYSSGLSILVDYFLEI